ncbi:MAG TPA: response regulator transcription factor [Nocardioides sp.]|jgi:two-component system OmpR family response regulator|nr:response regulator transcription factor [Nocardioides sp.]
MRVLLAEDDTRLAEVLEQSLTEAGWSVEVHHDGGDAFRAAADPDGPDTQSFDVLLLDWMLPTMDGLTLCRRIRSLGINTPVLMLTARSTTRDLVAGLEGGADDYIRKPYELEELLSRLRALYRRSRVDPDEPPVTVGELTLDPVAHRVTRGGVPINLSAREFDILHLLMSRAGKVVTRFLILDEVWDGETDLRSNVIDVHIAALRAKIDKRFGTDTITTLRGVGYRLEVPRRIPGPS